MNSGVLLLTRVYSQASFHCSEYFSLGVLCVFEAMCTGTVSALLADKSHDPVAYIGEDTPRFSRVLSTLPLGLGLCLAYYGRWVIVALCVCYLKPQPQTLHLLIVCHKRLSMTMSILDDR
jgi:hypothetical protein